MKMKLSSILAVVALFLVASCSSDSTSSVAATTTSSGDDVSGTWTKACFDDSTSTETSSFSTTLTLSGTTGTFSAPVYFTVADCSGDADATFAGTFTLDFIGTTTMTSGNTAETVDITDTAETLTVNTATGATAISGAYGFDDWAAGVSHDILELDESGATVTVTAEKNSWVIDLTSSPKTLTFGLTVGDGGTSFDADDYPTEEETTSFEQ